MACHRWRRRRGRRLGRWHNGWRRLSARRGAGGERGTSGRENPASRPRGGGGPAIPLVCHHAGVHREHHPAREHIHQRRRERGKQYRSPERRHRPRRAAPGPRLQVGSAGPHGEGGQFPAAVAIVRRLRQPPAGTAAGKGGSGQLLRIRRSRRAAELHQHGDRAAGR